MLVFFKLWSTDTLVGVFFDMYNLNTKPNLAITQIAIFLQMEVFSSGVGGGPIFLLWKWVWSQNIALKTSFHFSSSDPGYSSCYPDFFSPANPTSTFSLGHLIKKTPPALKRLKTWGRFGFLTAAGEHQEQLQGMVEVDLGVPLQKVCSSQKGRPGRVGQLRNARVALLWVGRRRALLPPRFHRIPKWSHSAELGWTASAKVSFANFNRDCNRMQLSAQVFSTIAS